MKSFVIVFADEKNTDSSTGSINFKRYNYRVCHEIDPLLSMYCIVKTPQISEWSFSYHWFQ